MLPPNADISNLLKPPPVFLLSEEKRMIRPLRSMRVSVDVLDKKYDMTVDLRERRRKKLLMVEV